MKTFALVLAVCIVGSVSAGLTAEQKAKLREHRVACTAETGVSSDAIDNVKKGILDEQDPKLACFAACFFKRVGFLNADGTFNEAVFRAKVPSDVPREKVDALIGKCSNLGGSNECEIGAKLYKCWLENRTIAVSFD